MKKLMAIVLGSLIVTFCVACTPENSSPESAEAISENVVGNLAESQTENKSIELVGTWITDLDGDLMLNPQTSGLKYDNGHLYSLSDGSAHETQILRLHQISMTDDARVLKKFGPTEFSENVRNSCFYQYLSYRPDYEALTPIPNEDDAWIFVTEDASRSEQLSNKCQQQYGESGSTFYPTLLVRVQVKGEGLEVTHVRPVQFPKTALVGDFPNDGIEGLTVTRDNRLLLGLEKDLSKHARVFEIALDNDFWQDQGFAKVQDSELLLPRFEAGNHPINGMDVFYPSPESDGYLFAAARNDNELWIIDLAKKKPTKKIKLTFLAPSDISQNTAENICEATHVMNNSSIEGVSVVNNTVWMINDPWKANYHKNIVCAADQSRYLQNSPLLFKIDIDNNWFE